MRLQQLLTFFSCALLTATSADAFVGIHKIPMMPSGRIAAEKNAMPDDSDSEIILQAALLAARDNFEKQLPILQSLAEIYRDQSRRKEEEACLLKIIGILHAVDGLSSVYAATEYMRLSSIYFEMEDFQKAEMAGQTAVYIFRKSCGPSSLNLALACNNLGWIEVKMKKFASAESHLSLALSILRRNLGNNHVLYGLIMQNFGELYWQRGDFAAAYKWYTQALRVLSRNLSPDDAAIVGLSRRCKEAEALNSKHGQSNKR